jgi:hypothetical protein
MEALTKFLAELVTRLFSENPKFFDIIQLISFIVGGLSALVMYLESTGVVMPKFFDILNSTTVIVGSVLSLILAQLPNAK